jgi:hypothetical protein
VTKSEFLRAYGFPDEWLLWNLYPDPLFEGQLAACAEDEEPHPDEHLRYGAFLWWLRNHRNLPVETLQQLSRLVALDPDPGMAQAAAHDILFHPSATDDLADELARLTENQPGWLEWISQPSPQGFFHQLLRDGRRYWLERHSAHRVACDIEANQLSESELRDLFALDSPLVLRGMVEHPGLPHDLLIELAKLENMRFAKEIRNLALFRLEKKRLPRSNYRSKYSTDPWTWPR